MKQIHKKVSIYMAGILVVGLGMYGLMNMSGNIGFNNFGGEGNFAVQTALDDVDPNAGVNDPKDPGTTAQPGTSGTNTQTGNTNTGVTPDDTSSGSGVGGGSCTNDFRCESVGDSCGATLSGFTCTAIGVEGNCCPPVDPNGCDIRVIAEDTSICGDNGGSMTLTASGGTGPYAYTWIGGITGNERSNLPFDKTGYIVTVVDSMGCLFQGSFSVEEPKNCDTCQMPLPSEIAVIPVTNTCGADTIGKLTLSPNFLDGKDGLMYTYNGSTYTYAQLRDINFPVGRNEVSYQVSGCDQVTFIVEVDEEPCLGCDTSTDIVFTEPTECGLDQNGSVAFTVNDPNMEPLTLERRLNGSTRLNRTENGLNTLTYAYLLTDGQKCGDSIDRTLTFNECTCPEYNLISKFSPNTCLDINDPQISSEGEFSRQFIPTGGLVTNVRYNYSYPGSTNVSNTRNSINIPTATPAGYLRVSVRFDTPDGAVDCGGASLPISYVPKSCDGCTTPVNFIYPNQDVCSHDFNQGLLDSVPLSNVTNTVVTPAGKFGIKKIDGTQTIDIEYTDPLTGETGCKETDTFDVTKVCEPVIAKSAIVDGDTIYYTITGTVPEGETGARLSDIMSYDQTPSVPVWISGFVCEELGSNGLTFGTLPSAALDYNTAISSDGDADYKFRCSYSIGIDALEGAVTLNNKEFCNTASLTAGDDIVSAEACVGELDIEVDKKILPYAELGGVGIVGINSDIYPSNAQIIEGPREDGESVMSDGDWFYYELSVINNGPFDASDVEITDALPSELIYVSHTGGNYNDQTNIWTVGDLASGEEAVMYLAVTYIDANPATDDQRICNEISAPVQYGDLEDTKADNNKEKSCFTDECRTLCTEKVTIENFVYDPLNSIASGTCYVQSDCGNTRTFPATWTAVNSLPVSNPLRQKYNYGYLSCEQDVCFQDDPLVIRMGYDKLSTDVLTEDNEANGMGECADRCGGGGGGGDDPCSDSDHFDANPIECCDSSDNSCDSNPVCRGVDKDCTYSCDTAGACIQIDGNAGTYSSDQSDCNNECVAPTCGDGFVDPSIGEECEPDNVNTGVHNQVACNEDCTIENPVESCECNIFDEDPLNKNHEMTSEDLVLIEACIAKYKTRNQNDTSFRVDNIPHTGYPTGISGSCYNVLENCDPDGDNIVLKNETGTDVDDEVELIGDLMDGSEDLDPNSTIKENGQANCGPTVCTNGYTLVGQDCVCTPGNVVIGGVCTPSTCDNPIYATTYPDICDPCRADGVCPDEDVCGPGVDPDCRYSCNDATGTCDQTTPNGTVFDACHSDCKVDCVAYPNHPSCTVDCTDTPDHPSCPDLCPAPKITVNNECCDPAADGIHCINDCSDDGYCNPACDDDLDCKQYTCYDDPDNGLTGCVLDPDSTFTMNECTDICDKVSCVDPEIVDPSGTDCCLDVLDGGDGICDPVCPVGQTYIGSACCIDSNDNGICDDSCDDVLSASTDRCVNYCDTVADCNNADTCESASCLSNQCVYVFDDTLASCECQTSDDCGDNDVCTLDSCRNNLCIYTPDDVTPSCNVECNVAADCPDYNDGNICTTTTCTDNECSTVLDQNADAVCTQYCVEDANCHDADVCTDDVCDLVTNTCTYNDNNSTDPVCVVCDNIDDGVCPADDICPNDPDCTQVSCNNNVCELDVDGADSCDASCGNTTNGCLADEVKINGVCCLDTNHNGICDDNCGDDGKCEPLCADNGTPDPDCDDYNCIDRACVLDPNGIYTNASMCTDVCGGGSNTGSGNTGGGSGGGGGNNYCGDGRLFIERGEECDDGNFIDGDGCSRNCKDEGFQKTRNSVQQKLIEENIKKSRPLPTPLPLPIYTLPETGIMGAITRPMRSIAPMFVMIDMQQDSRRDILIQVVKGMFD